MAHLHLAEHMEYVGPFCHMHMRNLLRLYADFHVYGRENVPLSGPFILIANHQSNLDPPLLGSTIRRRARFLAKDTLYSNVFMRGFMTRYGAYPVKRDGTDVGASRWALKQISDGYPLVVFPEGTRSPGKMRKAQMGVAYLARMAGVPILPAAITGTAHVGPIWRIFFPTGLITVTFGEPFNLPTLDGRVGREGLERLTDYMMRRVAALLPEENRGVYGGDDADEAWRASAPG